MEGDFATDAYPEDPINYYGYTRDMMIDQYQDPEDTTGHHQHGDDLTHQYQDQDQQDAGDQQAAETMVQDYPEPGAECDNYDCRQKCNGRAILCNRCMVVKWCSVACYRNSWGRHKAFCDHVETGGKSSKSYTAETYCRHIAYYDPEARALAAYVELHLDPVLNNNSM